jgi:hypothetical protein
MLVAKTQLDGIHQQAAANRAAAAARGVVTGPERFPRARRSVWLARPASAVGWAMASQPTRPF